MHIQLYVAISNSCCSVMILSRWMTCYGNLITSHSVSDCCVLIHLLVKLILAQCGRAQQVPATGRYKMLVAGAITRSSTVIAVTLVSLVTTVNFSDRHHDNHVLWNHKRWKWTHFTKKNCQPMRGVTFQERSASWDKVELQQVRRCSIVYIHVGWAANRSKWELVIDCK